MIETMPEVLAWQSGEEVLLQVHQAYLDLLSDRLGKLLAEASLALPAAGERLRAELRDLPDHSFARLLTAPETSYRLLWQQEAVAQTAEFLTESAKAERALAGGGEALTRETWTALGDVGFTPDGQVLRNPQVEGLMPLDFLSPRAAAVDLGGAQPGVGPRPPLGPADIALVTARLTTARDRLRQTSRTLYAFARHFNKVLISQRDPDDPNSFTSGSTGQYIGRSFLTNPQLDNVTEVGIAESLVHEGIHALLYMQEQHRPWVFTRDLYHPTQRLISPWTGRVLALRPYLQACFVWYGILNFWGIALSAGTFDQRQVQARMALAMSGFLRGPLIAALAPYRDGISEDVIRAIEAMQALIVQARAEVA